MRKVGIIGGGNVGATCAYQIASRGTADVAVYDILEGVPAGKALDMCQVGPIFGFDGRIEGSHDVSVIAGSEVVVVTAGFPRKPGMDRMDLLRKNADIASSAGAAIKEHAPDAVVVCVTNPLDVMTWTVWQATGFEPSRVVGMAGILDCARFSTFIAMELGCSPIDVKAMVLGGHGDSMVPLPRFSTVAGVPITELLAADRIEALSNRTRAGGAEIVKLLGTGSAYYAPGAAAALMTEAILNDSDPLLPCSAYLDGVYGLEGMYCGVPVHLGAKGVSQIVELDLDDGELEMLKASAAGVASGIADVQSLGAPGLVIRAAILGGTGYGGMELLRLLVGHPGVEVTALTSRSEEGPVSDRHPHLAGFTRLNFTKETEDVRLRLARENDVVFFAKPHGVSAAELPGLLDAAPDLKVIDLSGDFRLPDPSQYPTWYDFEHPHPERLGQAEYGLAECGHRASIQKARLVANPGCHASATILALWPLARLGMLKGRVSVVSVTSSSGSGARPKQGTHHPERFSNFKAYRPLHHQHLPEVLHALGGEARVDFVPHSAPFARGIHVTAFVPVGAVADEDVLDVFSAVYGDEPFIRMHTSPPDLRACVGTNFVDVCVTLGDGVACVTLTLDNLGKGMAGTAVQNLNLMCGLDETAGLDRPGAGL